MRSAALLLLILGQTAWAAPQLACHYSYGGETRTLLRPRLASVSEAYAQRAEPIGSYFLFRPVFEPDEIKLYTYVDAPDGPALIHQARYTRAAATRVAGRAGFTGEQHVYEPIRDSELTYWCEIKR